MMDMTYFAQSHFILKIYLMYVIYGLEMICAKVQHNSLKSPSSNTGEILELSR